VVWSPYSYQTVKRTVRARLSWFSLSLTLVSCTTFSLFLEGRERANMLNLVYCRNCREAIDPTDMFCKKCGADQRQPLQQTTQATPAQLQVATVVNNSTPADPSTTPTKGKVASGVKVVQGLLTVGLLVTGTVFLIIAVSFFAMTGDFTKSEISPGMGILLIAGIFAVIAGLASIRSLQKR
jgi:hypothetical protein